YTLFGAAGILGLAVGGLLTKPLVGWFGTENLLVVWAASLMIGLFLAREIMRFKLPEKKRRHRKPKTVIDDLISGYSYVRNSPLFKWMALAAVLFAILYYSVVFPFAKAISLEFNQEDEITAFLGVFQGLSMGATFLTALFISNRIYAHLGFMTAIFTFPALYFLGFTGLVVAPLFSVLVVFRFMQLLWSEGVSEGANQAMYNLVPSGIREQTRAFVRGIANPLGVSLAGVILLTSEWLESSYSVYLVGMVVAVITALLVWRAKKQYGQALFEALKNGQSQIFFGEDEPFGGFRRDATSVRTLIKGIKSQDLGVRRVSAEILANIEIPEAEEAIINGLNDQDDEVRIALMRAVSRNRIYSATPLVQQSLKDDNPELRYEAIRALHYLTRSQQDFHYFLPPMLDDPDPSVRNLAATHLLIDKNDPNAENVLRKLANHKQIPVRVEAIKSLGKWGTQIAYSIVEQCLKDPFPAVRQQAVLILVSIDPDQCITSLVEMLGDEDSAVQHASAAALAKVGKKALQPLIEALSEPILEVGALTALEYLSVKPNDPRYFAYIQAQVDRAVYYHGLFRTSPVDENAGERTKLLKDLLREKSLKHATRALKSLAVLSNNQEISLAIENLHSDNMDHRAYALELLDTYGKPELVRPLLSLWESDEVMKTDQVKWIETLLKDQDAWVHAAAVLALNDMIAEGRTPMLSRIAEFEPTSQLPPQGKIVVNGDQKMETLQTVSIMERIIFLRQVSLFANLKLPELIRIASIAEEHLYADGEILAEEGELGEEMFIIVSGVVRVVTQSKIGDELELARRVSGEVVGEMSIITRQPRMATLIAIGEVRTLCIENQDFEEILRLYPQTSLSVMRVLCDRVKERV
ncbi:MAG: MFS transporter, partial [Anaerolineales bacterium]